MGFVHSLRVSISTVTLQAADPVAPEHDEGKCPKDDDSPDHHRMLGPAAQKQTRLTTQLPRWDIFSPYLV